MSTLEPAITERIQSEINSQDVVLFMKGTPVFPQCGFSAALVGVLSHLGVQFRGVNVLKDNDIREGIKTFSNWPTIPQLYVKGEFMGGCDIIREMYETGELMEMFNTHGVDVSPQ
ncbi:MAG: Grx4 family monothiol glutaredoxin [Alphaproteobacteria bacterium]|nr:Grx4 family monothiol glutaredoxin [Alphaproteobacteria bacterium]